MQLVGVLMENVYLFVKILNVIQVFNALTKSVPPSQDIVLIQDNAEEIKFVI